MSKLGQTFRELGADAVVSVFEEYSCYFWKMNSLSFNESMDVKAVLCVDRLEETRSISFEEAADVSSRWINFSNLI